MRSFVPTLGWSCCSAYPSTWAESPAATPPPAAAAEPAALIVTEYNMMERAGPIKLSRAHALFMAAGALTLLGVPQADAALSMSS